MSTRRPAETTPDLFSALPTVKAAGPSAVPKGKAGPDGLASQQRHFLPNDLAGALKRLDDVEIDALLAAVTTEAERRGRRPPSPAKEKGKYPPAKPGALGIAPLKAALIDHAHYTHSMTDGLGPISSRAFARARMGPIHHVCTL